MQLQLLQGRRGYKKKRKRLHRGTLLLLEQRGLFESQPPKKRVFLQSIGSSSPLGLRSGPLTRLTCHDIAKFPFKGSRYFWSPDIPGRQAATADLLPPNTHSSVTQLQTRTEAEAFSRQPQLLALQETTRHCFLITSSALLRTAWVSHQPSSLHLSQAAAS